MVQIRNVPEDFHRRLKARAAIEGMSMSDYILREIGKSLERPTRDEVLKRLRARPVRHLQISPAEVIRAERDALLLERQEDGRLRARPSAARPRTAARAHLGPARQRHGVRRDRRRARRRPRHHPADIRRLALASAWPGWSRRAREA